MDTTSDNGMVVGTKIKMLDTNDVGKHNGMNGNATNKTPLTNGFHNDSHSERQSSNAKEPMSNGFSKTEPYPAQNQKTQDASMEATANPRASETLAAHVNIARTEFRFGPDQVVPCESVSTAEHNGRVKLNIGESGTAATKPISVPGMLHKTATAFPDKAALMTKNEDGTWITITYKEYETMVRTCAKAFLKLGLKRYQSVCIIGFNTPRWFISDFAAIYAGGFAAGVYTTNSPEACYHCAISSKANIIVVQDKIQLAKILAIKDRLPELKAIVQYEGKPEVEGVLSWDELMKIGQEESETELEKVMQTIAVNECCTLVYTSGTVGNPKAVMLSHDNFTWTAQAAGRFLDMEKGVDKIVSFLPLSHVAAQLVDLYLSCTYAATVYFADKNALKGSLALTLQDAKPTTILAVPRVWEKISEKMIQVSSEASGLKKSLLEWAKGVGLQHNMDKMNGQTSNSLQYALANMLIYRRVKRALGLEDCRTLLSGAAPISPETKKFFWSLDILLLEGFGMSESSGCQTLNTQQDFRLDSIGKTVSGCFTRIDNPDSKNQGEILMKGRNIFMGYLGDAPKTREALEDDGWLHSGDVGTIDKHGFVYITGRIKEVLITAGGENIPPVLIEQTIMNEIPCISNAVLIGDRKKFLTVLLTLKTDVILATGEPCDTLNPTAKQWCQGIGSAANTVTEILSEPDKKVMAAIQEGIDRANLKAISQAQRVQKFAILPKDFSIATGEMGPTMKIKRNVVVDKYAQIIDGFYEETS